MLLMFGVAIKTDAQNRQIKVYLQQIAANKVYIEFLEKGYEIARKGLTTIGDIKQAHFVLDGNFFKTLELINPRVKNYAKTAGSFGLINNVQQQIKQLRSMVVSDDLLSEGEKQYVNEVLENLQLECAGDFAALEMVVISSSLKMSDDERIKRIDDTYSEMQEMYAFVKAFATDMQLLLLQKKKEQRQVGNYRKMADLI